MKVFATIILLAGALVAIIVAVTLKPRAGHPVTPSMSSAAAEVSGQTISPLPGMTDVRPLVIVFILPECPCSEAYEPFTHGPFAAYGTRTQFIGVVGGDLEAARTWQQEHKTPYAVVADPDRSIARSCGAERSAYTVLVTEGQAIEHLWPGYSAGMLRELGSQLAAATDVPEGPLDVDKAPKSLTSGCPLDL